MPDMWGFAIQPGVGLSTLYTRKRWEYGFAWICKANFGGKKWRCVCGCFVWSCWGSSFGCGPSAHWWCPLLFDFLISGILCVSCGPPCTILQPPRWEVCRPLPMTAHWEVIMHGALQFVASDQEISRVKPPNMICSAWHAFSLFLQMRHDASLSLSALSNYSDCRLLTLKCVSILFTFVTDMPFFLVRS